MDDDELAKMKAEFEAKGGKVTQLPEAEFGAPHRGFGNLLKIEHAEHGGKKDAITIYVVYLFESKKTVRMLTREEDRVGVEVGKGYQFTFRPHLAGKSVYGGVDFVTRGIPSLIQRKKQPRQEGA